MRGRLRTFVVAIALVAAPARAHLGHVIQRAERYLKLDVAGHEARVVVSLTLGPAEGRRVLDAADRSGDGHVDEAERDAYLAQWGEGLATELPIQLDGEPQAVRWGEGWLDPIGPVRPQALTVEMIARVPLDGGLQTIRIEDRMAQRDVYDRTDVAFRARDGATLLASGEGEALPGRVDDLAYGGDFQAGSPVVLRARVQTPRGAGSARRRDGRERPPTMSWTAVAVVVALLSLALGALGWRRARRRPATGGRGS